MLTHWTTAEALACDHRRNLEMIAARRRLAQPRRIGGRSARRNRARPARPAP